MIPRVVLVTDPRYAVEHMARVIRWAAAALGHGRLMVQLRDKAGADTDVSAVAFALRAVTREARAVFVINDRTALACSVGADGVHLPSITPGTDVSLASRVAAVRASLGAAALVTAAVHDDDELRAASGAGATAAMVSPIFATPGKAAARGAAAIVSARAFVDAARRAPSLLVYALGGVDPERAAECADAGADGVAVIRALFDADGEAGVTAAALALAAPWPGAAERR